MTDENQAISDFQKDMISASRAMALRRSSWKQQQWKDAVPNEQKALQFLLRAEATFRKIQVAFGARGGGGGGGGGGGAARDLAALLDLELDTEKNQYETQQSAKGTTTAEQKAQEVDDVLKKLDDLAKREEGLAQQQRNGTQTAEQKWQQEMLQREAEQLKQQMEQQLAQNSQSGQQGQQSGQQSGQQASGQSGRGGQSGSSASGRGGQAGGQQSPEQAADSRQQAAQQALERLKQATDDMKRAASQSASAADSRRAADRLREATDLLGGAQQQDASGRLNSMSQTAEQLAQRQKQQADYVRSLMAQQNAAKAAGQQPKGPTAQEIDKLINDRQQVTDDLSRLTQQLRTAARELAPTQPGASSETAHGARCNVDENDLGKPGCKRVRTGCEAEIFPIPWRRRSRTI